MYISYNWLYELTGTILTPAELRESLTMVGLAIDAVEDKGSDSIIDVEVPSNRPDCLSHIGIAREVAVIESGQVTFPLSKPPTVAGRTEDLTSIAILDPHLCPRYAARIVRGVKIAPSPEWLTMRLEAIGQRPINNVADITNYVLHELGQPLHAFDLARLNEERIIVRRAASEETLKTLDGVERKLEAGMLVIADAQRPVALAGIMGGEDSEISSQTTDVLIESAYFNPDSVRQTARALGMDTEASRRFERGADYGGVIRAQQRCIELICEIAGGVATENVIDVVGDLPPERRIEFHFARVEELTSLRVAVPEMLRILKGLGFVIANEAESNEGSLTFIVPTWRIDVEREEDLIEEIARHSGYDRIGSELPAAHAAGEYQPQELTRRALRRSFLASGYDEAINFSFIDTATDDQIELLPNLGAQLAATRLRGRKSKELLVTLRNPIVENAVRMRPSLVPGLLSSLRHNLNHGERDVSLFEIGRIFAAEQSAELPHECEALAFIASGGVQEAGRAQASREIDFYDAKGALEAAVDATRFGPLQFEKVSARHLREGQTAAIKLHGEVIGSLGRLSESVAASYKFRQAVYVGELDLTAFLASAERPVLYRPLARYPGVSRDVTFLVSRDVAFADLLQAVLDDKEAECRKVQLVGVYEGANIPEDKRSITLRFEYRSDERTLRDDEVEERHRSLVAKLAQKFNAELH
ncbi:MAG: phenylalanyl-tRNA synthetase, beta subunit, non-spirochete bacterial [Acidobacteria bacterium]|nr:phenylalanyl-tRNA synthetase, beta subunit, non-spirochete bacterial [Acidobacteriota bacterium]